MNQQVITRTTLVLLAPRRFGIAVECYGVFRLFHDPITQ